MFRCKKFYSLFCYSPKPEFLGPSPEGWSSIRGIGAYRSLGYSSRNVIVKCYIWSGNLPLGFTRCNAIENVVVKMAAYLLNGNQPPLIIALECEIEKGGP
jgi:hypothetical protein